MLFILFFIAMFVGLPYILQKIQPNQVFNFSSFLKFIPRFIATSTPGYFYGKFQPSIFQSQPQPQTQSQSKKVSIGNISRYGANEQIGLSASSFSGAVNITGWRIKSARRGEFVIGQGLNLPQFDTASADIWLTGGESAEIIAGASPMAGSFHVNSCFGGLSDVYNLGYSFNSCPGIAPGDFTGLDSACEDLILRSASCRAPSDDVLNKQSSKCRIWFENNVNYSFCVAKHRNDGDFYKGWKIYTGNGNQIFDPLHDKIELRDQTGALIDSYEY